MGPCPSRSRDDFDSPDSGYLTIKGMPKRDSRSYSFTRRRQESTARTNSAYIRHSDGDIEQTYDEVSQSRDMEIRKMVEVFQPCIEEAVHVMDIVPRLIGFIDDAGAELSRCSQREAVRRLLNTLKASPEPGRWRAFIDALDTGGYPYLVRLLNGHTEKDNSTQRKLLKLLQPELIRNIDLNTCPDKLYERHVLHEQDLQQITCERGKHGGMAACMLLLDYIPRRAEDDWCERQKHGDMAACLLLLDYIPRRAEDWFEEFVAVLEASGAEHLAEKFELGNVYVEPPTRCKIVTGGSFDSSQNAYSKRDSQVSEGPDTSETVHGVKIRRLSLHKANKERELKERTKIAQLTTEIKDINGRIDMLQHADDSSLELEMTSETHVKSVSRGQVSPNTYPKFYAQQSQHSPNNGHVRSTQQMDEVDMSTGMSKEQTKQSQISELVDKVNTLIDEVKTLKVEQRAGTAQLQAGVKDLHSELIAAKNDFAANMETLKESVRHISEHLVPPSPHTMKTVDDSAFSDCSIVSITSL